MLALACITGKPAIVFTENKTPDRSSSTENKVPWLPFTVNILVLPVEPEPYITNEPEAP